MQGMKTDGKINRAGRSVADMALNGVLTITTPVDMREGQYSIECHVHGHGRQKATENGCMQA